MAITTKLVHFKRGSQADYLSKLNAKPSQIDEDSLYFLEDTKQLFFGSKEFITVKAISPINLEPNTDITTITDNVAVINNNGSLVIEGETIQISSGTIIQGNGTSGALIIDSKKGDVVTYKVIDDTLTELSLYNAYKLAHEVNKKAEGIEDLAKSKAIVVDSNADDVTIKKNETSDGIVIPTKAYVESIVNAVDAMTYKGTVDSTDELNNLQTSSENGDTYKASSAFSGLLALEVDNEASIPNTTLDEVNIEVGDIIIARVIDGVFSGWSVIQGNIDGAVITDQNTSVKDNIAVFSDTSGRKIEDSTLKKADVSDAISKKHSHSNKATLDTYNKTQTKLLEDVDTKISTAVETAKEDLESQIDNATLKWETIV